MLREGPPHSGKVHANVFGEDVYQRKLRLSDEGAGSPVLVEMCVPAYYEILGVLGQGAYGTVVAASARIGDEVETVALKQITQPFHRSSRHALLYAKRVLRELRFLRHLQHENIIELKTVFCSGSSRDNLGDVYVVTEVMDVDLEYILHTRRPFQPLQRSHAKFFLYSLLRGLKYIHSADVIHRDLKPGNLLVNRHCDLRICDLGLARLSHLHVPDARLSEYVGTRWYRAPEVLCCWSTYTKCVDVWSAGVIFAEMLLRRRLFKGSSTLDQLRRIQAILGSPTADEIAKVSNDKAREYLSAQPLRAAADLQLLLSREDEGGGPEDASNDSDCSCDPDRLTGGSQHSQHSRPSSGSQSRRVASLRIGKEAACLHQMLQFDPDTRQDCAALLAHPYLEKLHDPDDEPEARPIPAKDFEFERRRLAIRDFEQEAFQEMLQYHPDCGHTSSFDVYALPVLRPPPSEDQESERSESEASQESMLSPVLSRAGAGLGLAQLAKVGQVGANDASPDPSTRSDSRSSSRISSASRGSQHGPG